MKAIFLTIFIFSLSYCCFAQVKETNFSISNPRQKILYIGIENSLEILVKNYPCSAIKIKVDNGEITQNQQSCGFSVNPSKSGLCKMEVWNTINQKLIGNVVFNSVMLPKPEIRVAGKSSGSSIPKKFMQAQRGLLAKLDGFDIDVNYEIVAFRVIALRGDKIVFNFENAGSKFSEKTSLAIQTIEARDRIIFSSITYRELSGQIGSLNPVEFIITD